MSEETNITAPAEAYQLMRDLILSSKDGNGANIAKVENPSIGGENKDIDTITNPPVIKFIATNSVAKLGGGAEAHAWESRMSNAGIAQEILESAGIKSEYEYQSGEDPAVYIKVLLGADNLKAIAALKKSTEISGSQQTTQAQIPPKVVVRQ